ncbi:MAG: flagellar biosynthesis anti-sigma factor FlgM [Candidatus Thiodiazotropha sp. (ex Lucina aurantia)]|uniref:Negative regulator of flagellin synthesis n=1 Tax=Candidatus Thiodiazotropha taylori TaxID=2792791 RepID=A0A9E4TXA8_9GAMM|nr:flagellar biosynthesis anti-sigma factor FlgM [Candidatus Thiodiazotropha sp. (ex Lucina pensylvanica)]MBT3014745.1 flagellar biosynthesis anti-sigma factor FlgM [Candidatus Thiodiazotropha taylori]MBT3039705.1 flagellar biosynthesis anti-sigma factor FlgM [Candidatus Thiodiazotropha sp. (ex Codakia orbicularis)]MBV2103778.1 flagellar biosynthesis anti-sigma factor FlgM [Candidatus Thiodiazotropha sp. (ex Lucina aurantia)]MBW9266337.1 flagellar biosynthesis anti-sigma factor FlgM [Candidatus
MAVEINSLSSSNLKGTGDSGLVTRSGLPGGKRSATSTTSTRKDRFDMTGSAGKLLELEARIAQMPIVDAQKVEAVQKALATGSFTIDPQTAADKMLAMELALP